jgi:outer membrane lipoprotein-sorting protein
MQNKTDHFDDLLDQASQAILDHAPHDLPPSEIVEATKTRTKQLASSPLSLAKPIRSHEIRRWAIAAIAIAASFMVAVSLLFTAPSAFAQVVERVRQIKTARFTVEFNGVRQGPDFTAQATVKSPDRLRFDFDLPNNPVNITNGAAGELISYDASSNMVTVNEIPKAHADFDILRQLQSVDTSAVEVNAENSVDGTDLYIVFDGKGRVWVDKTSKLPIRVEVTSHLESGASKTVYRDFQWDVPVDDKLFRIPEGRSIVRSSLLARPTEAELIAAFQIRHAFNQSPYDADFLADQVGLRLGQLAYDLTKNQAENAEIQRAKLKDYWTTLGISMAESQDSKLVQRRIDYLCMKLDQWESDITRTGGWVGDGVRPGEPSPLCWWKADGKIRVLRGDLSIVDADQPPSGKQ